MYLYEFHNGTLLSPQSLLDLGDESLPEWDTTRNSQLDITLEESRPDESLSASESYVEGGVMLRGGGPQLSVCQTTFSGTDFQPEESDKELEMSLSSQGSSLVDLYPGMISQIGRAQHRQRMSKAAHSVLRRYRKWRWQANRSSLEGTFNSTLRHANKPPQNTARKTTLKEAPSSPSNKQFPGVSRRRSETAPLSALHDWNSQQRSPEGGRGSLRRDMHQPVLVMDFSRPSQSPRQKRDQLNETFTVMELSPSSLSQSTVRPSWCYSPSAKASLDLSPRSRRLSHSGQPAGCSMSAPMFTTVKDSLVTSGSPARRSPLKARVVVRETLRGSPYAVSRSPPSDFVSSHSSEPLRSRPHTTFLSSPPRKFLMPQTVLEPRDSAHSPQPARLKLRRHLSFDSSLPSIHASYSQKDLDDDLKRFYHKFVCQSKSPLNGPPCQMCARASEARRDHSSRTLVALALSPHRFALKKRHRELDWENRPLSKRSREGYCTYSPGSKRHGREMLRRRLCLTELDFPHNGFFQSSSQRLHGDVRQVRGWPRSGAESSCFGDSVERNTAPRKWW
ncbi:uncharacterized protein ACBR49_008541 [Aulostomus maculatus]